MSARRVAYLWAIDMALWALARVDPSLSERAVAVMDSGAALPSARVIACTSAARTMGVRVGQSGQQARTVAPEIFLRGRSPDAERSARGALADAAATLSPRLEIDREGVWAEVGELGRLHTDEVSLATALGRAARSVGLQVSVAIAGGKHIARIAARRHRGAGVTVVPEARARDFLAGLPIEAMGLSEALCADLVRFGITRASELASLASEAVGLRLGEEAARGVLLARGIDDDPMVPRPLPMRFEEAMDFDWELSEVEPLMFATRRVYEALVARLSCRALAVGALSLSFTLSSRVLDERMVTVASPTRDVLSLLKLTRASLDASPPIDSVCAIRVVAVPAALKPMQLGLFDPPGPAPDKLALTLTKLVALVGDHRVGAPRVPDTWRPHAVAVATFNPPREKVGAREATTMALHIFRPPRAAEVVLSEGRIVRVMAREVTGKVLACGGPWRASGHWWSSDSPEGFDHEVYDLELDDGGIYLLGFDRVRGCWQLDGVYE